MDTLYIVMPAYNEEENIESVVRSWYPVLEGEIRVIKARDRGQRQQGQDA